MNDKCSAQERCEAILALSPERPWDRRLLFKLIRSEVARSELRSTAGVAGYRLEREGNRTNQTACGTLKGPAKELAERAISKTPPSDLPKHQDVSAWMARTDGDGDPQAGERIFYHSRVAGCFRCHEFEGRGNTVGPDLSTIGKSMTRERLVQSLVDPSREIAPQFTSYSILKHDGELLTGIHIGDEVDGRMRYVDPKGTVFYVHPNEVEQRQPSSQSIMPEGLVDQLTQQELRDLVAFLLRL